MSAKSKSAPQPMVIGFLGDPAFGRRKDAPIPAGLDELHIPEYWQRASEIVHLDPETYVPQEVVQDEILTRIYADQGRPYPIPNRPAPMPDNDVDFLNDPSIWEYREEVRVCENCGEAFLAHAHNHRYCSTSCQRQAAGTPRVCLQCGREFYAYRREQVYCSIACTGRAKRNPANDRLCVWCGTAFHATRPSQRFCSRTCAWGWRRAHSST